MRKVVLWHSYKEYAALVAYEMSDSFVAGSVEHQRLLNDLAGEDT